MAATRFTDLEVTGDLTVHGKTVAGGITEADYAVTAADAAAAAGTAPTKAEFDAVVTLVNELKSDYNALLHMLATGGGD